MGQAQRHTKNECMAPRQLQSRKNVGRPKQPSKRKGGENQVRAQVNTWEARAATGKTAKKRQFRTRSADENCLCAATKKPKRLQEKTTNADCNRKEPPKTKKPGGKKQRITRRERPNREGRTEKTKGKRSKKKNHMLRECKNMPRQRVPSSRTIGKKRGRRKDARSPENMGRGGGLGHGVSCCVGGRIKKKGGREQFPDMDVHRQKENGPKKRSECTMGKKRKGKGKTSATQKRGHHKPSRGASNQTCQGEAGTLEIRARDKTGPIGSGVIGSRSGGVCQKGKLTRGHPIPGRKKGREAWGETGK